MEQASGETHLCEGLNSLLLLPAQPPALSCHLLPQRLELFLQDLDAALQGTPILVTQVAAWVGFPGHPPTVPGFYHTPSYTSGTGERGGTLSPLDSLSFLEVKTQKPSGVGGVE